MRINTKNKTKLEQYGKIVLRKIIENINYPHIVKNVIFDENRRHSYFDDDKNTIFLGIKKTWNPNTIIEMFLHELFHCFSHNFCKSNKKICDVFLNYIRKKYKYRGWEFEKLHSDNKLKDDKILDDFSDHLIVLFNVINIMTKQLNVKKNFFFSKNEMYHKFILYLIKNYNMVKKTLKKFGLIYKFSWKIEVFHEN